MAGRKLNTALETIHSDIDVYRQRIAQLLSDLEAVNDAPAPEEEVRSRVEIIVQRAESQARQAWSPERLMTSGDPLLGAAFRADTLGAIAMIHGSQTMVEFLTREVLAASSTAGVKPMTSAEKAAENERIENAVFDDEVSEERLIRSARGEYGATIPRRSDIRNPVVIIATDAGLRGA